MNKTNSERQAQYRRRRSSAGENGERRLNTWVSTAASLALARLAAHQGLTRRAMLEQLILTADQAVTANLELDGEPWRRYFGQGNVTQ